MYLYFIEAYVDGYIVSYRVLNMKAQKLKTAEIVNNMNQGKKIDILQGKISINGLAEISERP